MSTQKRRFICENPGSARPCRKATDLVIALDVSSSMNVQVQTQRQFCQNISKAFSPLKENRVGFLTYDDKPFWQFHLGTYLSEEDIEDKILNPVVKTPGTNQNNYAIEAATQELEENTRLRVTKNILIVSDGDRGLEPTKTPEAVQKAVNSGIKMFSVCVNANLTLTEVEVIAGGNKQRVFRAASWEILHKLADMVNSICNT